MNRHRRPTLSGWAIVALSVAALALGACGRKGALDLPPNIASPTASNVAPAPMDTQGETMSRPGLSNPGYGMDASPAAARGQRRPFALDPLLDSGGPPPRN